MVVNKSTVPVGSTLVVERALGRSDVHVVSNPEFLREGSAVHDFLNPDRIVIGADDQAAAVRVASLYLGIAAPLIVTDPPSAETIKYAANAFLATKISFVNAIAAVCEAVGADMNDVVLGMGYDKPHRPRVPQARPRLGWELLRRRRDRFSSVATGGSGCSGSTSCSPRSMRDGADGWEALSWRVGDPTPEFLPVSRFTARPYDGDVVTVTTKMGRVITTTADHPFVVADGIDDRAPARKLASELTTDDWLPIAQGSPLVLDDPQNPGFGRVLDALGAAGLGPQQVIARLDDVQRGLLADRVDELPPHRRRDVLRSRNASAFAR